MKREAYARRKGLADTISSHLLPKTRAWHEIWVGEERVADGTEEDEPI